MAKNITLMGADYPQVPAVQLPQTGGGTATFYDIDSITFGEVTWDTTNVTGDQTRKKWYRNGMIVCAGLEFTPISGKITNGAVICTGLPIPYDANYAVTSANGMQMKINGQGELVWYFPTQTKMDRIDILITYIASIN